MWSLVPNANGKFNVMEGERLVIPNLRPEDADAIHFYMDCADFVAKCSKGVLGHTQPAQDILRKHGVSCG